jgi:hypothetical protein
MFSKKMKKRLKLSLYERTDLKNEKQQRKKLKKLEFGKMFI